MNSSLLGNSTKSWKRKVLDLLDRCFRHIHNDHMIIVCYSFIVHVLQIVASNHMNMSKRSKNLRSRFIR